MSAPVSPPAPSPQKTFSRVKTPTVLQMEAVECGAAALGMVLEYYGKYVPLEQVRVACGVSRDGSKASNMMRAAEQYGLIATAYRKEPNELRALPPPMIVHWNFDHFLVVEGLEGKSVYVNDPASGPRQITFDEFDQGFTGIVMLFKPGPEFIKTGTRPSLVQSLQPRLRGSNSALAFAILAGLFLVIPGLVIPTFARIFVDGILVAHDRSLIIPLIIGMLLTAALRAALSGLQQYALARLQVKLALTGSARFLWHLLHLPVEFFSQRYPGEITARSGLNDQVAVLLSGQLATTLLNLVVIVFYALLMLTYDVVLTLVGVGLSLVNLVVLRAVSRRRLDDNRRVLQEQGKLAGASMAGLQMIETLKATGGESDFFSHWAGYQAKVVNAQQAFGISSQLLSVVPPFLNALTTAAILVLGGFRVMEGALTVGMLVAFQSLMASFSDPITQLVNLGAQLQQAGASLNRLDDVLKYPTDDGSGGAENGNPATGTLAPAKLAGTLEFRDVTFGYSRFDPPLLSNLSFRVRPGGRVALVGATGSGKSTIAKLATGLYAPWSGEILLDDKPRAQLAHDTITNSLAMVDQDIFLFEGTVQDNLTLWDTTVPQSQVIRAAQDACIHDDISARAGAYAAHVQEDGRNFSGGQRQRLEIARALVAHPTLLVLDEATSALDPLTEQIIDDKLRQRGCACLIIAHRLSTIRDADEILVLEQGKVVQRGSHDDLIQAEGPYATLIKMAGPTQAA